MDRMSLLWLLTLGLPVLTVHLLTIALTKAIQSYSLLLLESRCAAKGRPERSLEVDQWDHKTERSAEALAVLTGLMLAAMTGLALGGASSSSGIAIIVLTVLAIGLLGYGVAGVVGKVFAEVVIDVLWPLARPVRVAAWPLTFGLRQIEHLMDSFGGRGETVHRPAHLELEIPVEEAQDDEDAEHELPESAHDLLQRAVALTRTDVRELMTPRSSIVALASTVTATEAAATFHRTGLSRVPLFEENRDDVVGVLYAKDLFARLTDGCSGGAISPRQLARPVVFVPESKNAYDLLEELRSRRIHVAIVLDEYGSVAGLITLEDLLEALVGPIDDEHDKPEPADPLVDLGDSRYQVDATVPLDVLNERLGLHLPTDGEFHTVGGLVFHELGRLPKKGDRVSVLGVTLTVVDVSDHTVRRLIVETTPRGVAVASGSTSASD
jgi:CBS domain containing-hemolysin-like protein